MLVKPLPTLSCQGFSIKCYQLEYKFYVGLYMVFGVDGRKIWVNCENWHNENLQRQIWKVIIFIELIIYYKSVDNLILNCPIRIDGNEK